MGSGCYFLLAAMEKSEHGVREMDTAIERAAELRAAIATPADQDFLPAAYARFTRPGALAEKVTERNV